LIKIAYSTINPYDKYLLATQKVDASRLGSDGSGTIVEVGEGVDQALVGKRVAFFGEGWGQYKVQDTEYLVFLDDSQDLSKAANACVNPLTACAQFDLTKKHGAKAAIITAASSQLAKQYLRLCQTEGIEVIAIVRRDEQVK
jgi:NADPH2:quinone reductase